MMHANAMPARKPSQKLPSVQTGIIQCLFEAGQSRGRYNTR